jgi:hypothetical protein
VLRRRAALIAILASVAALLPQFVGAATLTSSASLYVDLDPQSGAGAISLPANADWHTRTKSPAPISGEGSALGNAFAVADNRWRVSFARVGGPLGPGSFQLGSGACAAGSCQVAVNVAGQPANKCVASSGNFTIFDLAFGGGDLTRAEVDFRLLCGSFLMAGSIRFATGRSVLALDQNADKLAFGSSPVGVATAAKSVTISNFGNTKVPLGSAAIAGPAQADYSITSDTCSGITLAVQGNCKISVAFNPGAGGDRSAMLTLPDTTPGGARRLVLTGTGATVPMTVTAPVDEFTQGASVDDLGLIKVRVRWSSTGPVVRYELAQQTDDDGTWVVLSSNLSSTTYDVMLQARHRYVFRVRGFDALGNATSWATGTSGWLWPIHETSGDITYTGSWRLTYPNCLFWDWGDVKSGQAGATASFTFPGRSIAWVARMGPDRGLVNVYVDGVMTTLDLYSASWKDRRLVFVQNWSSVGTHTIKIEVVGTTGHPYADVDAFAILD